jgi:hypothetical protein
VQCKKSLERLLKIDDIYWEILQKIVDATQHLTTAGQNLLKVNCRKQKFRDQQNRSFAISKTEVSRSAKQKFCDQQEQGGLNEMHSAMERYGL